MKSQDNVQESVLSFCQWPQGLAASASTWTCLTKSGYLKLGKSSSVPLIQLGPFPSIATAVCRSRVGKAWCHRACLQEAEGGPNPQRRRVCCLETSSITGRECSSVGRAGLPSVCEILQSIPSTTYVGHMAHTCMLRLGEVEAGESGFWTT